MRHIVSVVSGLWAVALTFLREMTRSGGFRFFALTLTFLAWTVPSLAATDNYLAQLRIIASYGLGVPLVLIGLASIVFSTGSMSRELEARYLHLALTKPMPRPAFLAGKVLGVLILDVVLIVAVLCVCSVRIWVASTNVEGPHERARAHTAFFSPRDVFVPELPEVDEAELDRLVKERVEAIRGSAGGDHDQDGDGVQDHGPEAHAREDVTVPRDEIAKRFRRTLATRRIPAQRRGQFVFRGLRPNERSLPLVFRVRPFVLPVSQLELETEWRVGSVSRRVMLSQGSIQEIEFPSALIDPDGTIRVSIRNVSEESKEDPSLVLAPDALKLQQVYGSFGGHVCRSLMLVISQLVFIACLGVGAAAVFTLPTAQLLGLVAYAASLSTPFLFESLEFFGRVSGGFVGRLVIETISAFLYLLPDSVTGNPAAPIASSHAIPVDRLGETLLRVLGVRVTILFVFAAIVFQRKEIGASSQA
ncbi:MAG: ABC transporter permease subunit [Planctomycetota bacterium]